LFIHNQDGTATDHAADAGIDFLDSTRSALIVDLDNDGCQDLVVAMRSGVLILQGDGKGHFTCRQIIEAADALSLAAADYDNAGKFDIFVCAYSAESTEPDLLPAPNACHDATNGGRNILLHNEGNWRFKDVTASVGLEEHGRRFSRAAVWEDFDNDG